MVRRIYLIGAGASVPYGLPAMTNLTRELMATLSAPDKQTLERAIIECFGQPDDNPNFEELLYRLEPEALRYLEDSGLLDANTTRVKALRIALRALRSFINKKCAEVAYLEGAFDRLVQSLSEEHVVITFNWDVLIELAILRSGREYAYLPSDNMAGAIVILKPHGSINWFALLDREGIWIKSGSNLRTIAGEHVYYLTYANNPLDPIDEAYLSEPARSALSREPAIVPPTAAKILSVGGTPSDDFVRHGHTEPIKETWRVAARAFNEASEVVVIGYSLPGTDATSMEALKHFAASTTATKPKRVLMVEPDDRIADRYRSLLGLETEIVCRDFGIFDASKF
jgi:hypothetical protein